LPISCLASFDFGNPIAKLTAIPLLDNGISAVLGVDKDTVSAFEHYFQARNQCPCLVQPHLFLAAHADVLHRAEAADEYLQRACWLDPSNAKVWYAAGETAWEQGGTERSWECWRRSLECDASHLVPILARAAPVISTEELIQSVIPPDAEVLYEAFVQLDKANPRGEGHDRCLTKALEILKDSGPESSRFLLEARIQARLRRVDAAIHAYQHALIMRPERTDWRYELSEYLTAAGKLGEARSELLTLLSLSPADARARDLYDAVIREIAAKEHPQ